MTDDLISRQAVLDRKYVVEVKNMWHMTEEIEVVNVDDIKALPPVTPQEPKTGHWSRKTKVDAYDIAGVKTWGIKCQCDRCDFTTIVVEDFGYYKYCPNCGCRMVEPQKSEEEE